jgi:hypothetical protein
VTHYVVQHYFQDVSGLAEDRYTNVFHVEKTSGSLDAAGLLALLNNFVNFYGTAGAGQSNTIQHYMAAHSIGINARVAVYAHGVAPPNPPLLYLLYNPAELEGAGSTAALPAEVASCISYSGAPVAGVKMASVRGRCYLGPLNQNAVTPLGGTKARPHVDFRNDAILAFKYLNQAIPDDNPNTYLRQYSPTRGALHPITNWWMDDAWDTQRRRGGVATSRVAGTP